MAGRRAAPAETPNVGQVTHCPEDAPERLRPNPGMVPNFALVTEQLRSPTETIAGLTMARQRNKGRKTTRSTVGRQRSTMESTSISEVRITRDPNADNRFVMTIRGEIVGSLEADEAMAYRAVLRRQTTRARKALMSTRMRCDDPAREPLAARGGVTTSWGAAMQ